MSEVNNCGCGPITIPAGTSCDHLDLSHNRHVLYLTEEELLAMYMRYDPNELPLILPADHPDYGRIWADKMKGAMIPMSYEELHELSSLDRIKNKLSDIDMVDSESGLLAKKEQMNYYWERQRQYDSSVVQSRKSLSPERQQKKAKQKRRNKNRLARKARKR